MDLPPTSNAAAAPKIQQPCGLSSGGPLDPKAFGAGGVASRSQSAPAMLPRRALPAARLTLAHSFPIYEMGSINILPPGFGDANVATKHKQSNRRD